MKSEVPIILDFAIKNDGSKATAVFGQFTLLRLTILTLSRNNAETKRVDYHCFKCGNVFVVSSEKKMFLQKEAFSFACSKIKTSRIQKSLANRLDGKTVIRNQNSSSRKSLNESD